jgi:membrane protein
MVTRRFVAGLNAHNAFEAAASIAFWFFLSFVPLLVLLGFLVGQVARSRGVDALLGPLLDVVPGTAEDIVRKELERLAGANASLAPVGVVGYFWTASSGLHNLMDVFETAVKVERRPWWKQRLYALGWVLLGLATACLLAWLLVRVDAAIHAHDAPPPVGIAASGTPLVGSPSIASPPSSSASAAPARAPADHAVSKAQPAARVRGTLKRRVNSALHTPLEQVIAAALMLVLGMILLAGFYRFAVVHPPGVRRRFWPGTVTAVVLWLLVSYAFGEYVTSMSSYALYYGSLAAVAVMLVWLYLTSLTLVVGAEVNAQLEGVRDGA